jgi:hypothetical protein
MLELHEGSALVHNLCVGEISGDGVEVDDLRCCLQQ